MAQRVDTTIAELFRTAGLDAASHSREKPEGNAEGAAAIANGEQANNLKPAPVLSLLFDAAARPDVATIRALEAECREFAISHEPATAADREGEEGDWLELLVNGLTFDLLGLAPGPAYSPDQLRHRFGLPDSFEPQTCRALALQPGPHLIGGSAMLPVVRGQLWLATRLCALPGVVAIGWSPARSVCGVEHFLRYVRNWLEGGLFPGLGLTALSEIHDGASHSEGLAFFTGQELRIEPELAADKDGIPQLLMRLTDDLVRRGRITRPDRIGFPQIGFLRIAPSGNGRFVRVWPDGP